MAKEMMIVFVYDTAKCCKEEDDPAEAVIYFHPAWVSLTQRLALAGQLMGVYYFLATSFSAPRSITLQGGKFVLKKLGQYVLAVGTDRNIQDWILERRADILESLLKFFHCDLAKILNSLNNDQNRFTEKLYQIFETYLPILQYSANLFSNIPVIKLPKSASNIFLEAIQMLQYFQETNGILGGALFYNNKVVATQLGADLTKQIIITDPYRIKAPAERIPTEFHVPVGVQLLQVYIDQEQFAKLIQEARNVYYYLSCLDIITTKTFQRKKSGIKEPFVSSTSSGMKRDASRIFTVPEEGEEDDPTANYDDNLTLQHVPSVPLTIHDSPSLSRFKQQENKMAERAKAITTASTSSLTPSVCATPLKDVNRILHDTAVIICGAPDDNDEEKKRNNGENDRNKSSSSHEKHHNDDDIPDVVKQALRCKRLNKLRNITSKEKLMKRREPDKKSVSMPNLTSSVDPNSISKTRQIELNKISFNEDSPVEYRSGSLQLKSLITRRGKRRSRTITDPCYPVFRCDGLLVSQSLYEQYVASCYSYELRDDEVEDVDSFRERYGKLSSRNQLPCDEATSVKLPTADSSQEARGITCEAYTAEDGCSYLLRRSHQKTQKRRSMRLPLKPVNLNDEDKGQRIGSTSVSWNFPPARMDGFHGLQLTPLMSKLSLLASEQESSTRTDTTPNDVRPNLNCASFAVLAPVAVAPAALSCATTSKQVSTPTEATTSSNNQKQISNRKEEATSRSRKDRNEKKSSYQMELFLCGYQNMVLVLLMENGTANNPDLIHVLWKTCVETLGKLETRLQQCLEPLPSTDNSELYSILTVDPQWDTIHRTGLWGVAELEIVSRLHDKFLRSHRYLRDARYLTDITVRTEDTVIYGNQCGRIEVFYQQTASPNNFGTLPTPADLMGIVALKAKRRLERDHGIVLL